MTTFAEAFPMAVKYFNGDELAADVFLKKYALTTPAGDILEPTPDLMHRRLAKEFARIESKYPNPMSEEDIFGLFDQFKYAIPQGSPMAGIGNQFQTVSLSNCFVIPGASDSFGGIHRADEEQAQIMKRRGGVGHDVSEIRPKGVYTSNAAKTTDGIGVFMEQFSDTTRRVAQGGRRGALMLTCSIHHPESETFINIKNDRKKVTGANLSLRVSDEFLTAVKNGTTTELRWPVTAASPVVRFEIEASKLWDKVIDSAWENAEPGVLFWDTIVRRCPADAYAAFGFGTISTNPCCFAKSQEYYVVTKTGIKEIKQITPSDQIYVNETGTWEKTSGYFDAGTAQVFDVRMSNGTILRVTENHKLCQITSTRSGTKVIHTEGPLTELKNLKVGDKIACHTTPTEGIIWPKKGTYDEGLVLGWLTGDGCLSFKSESESHPSMVLDFWESDFSASTEIHEALTRMKYDLKLTSQPVNNKRRIQSSKLTEDLTNKYQFNPWQFKSETAPAPFLFEASREFIVGYLKSYFGADGTVGCNHESSNYNIQLSSINRARLVQIQSLMLPFGIKSSISLGRAAGESEFKNSGKYQTKDCWRLTITGMNNLQAFHDHIGFATDPKNERLADALSFTPGRVYKSSNYTTITEITPIGVETVGCIEVENAHKFTANGIISGNSELTLSAYDSCRLLLINLWSFVKNPFTNKATFDYNLFAEVTQKSQRLMDDLVDMELECIDKILAKIEKDPESDDDKRREKGLWTKIRKACDDGRRTGLGVTAVGDAIAGLNLRYGSTESVDTVEKIYKILAINSYKASCKMAGERGAFPIFSFELEKNHEFIQQVVKSDPELTKLYRKHGRRNIANTTTAPAGSVSLLTQTTSGIECAPPVETTRRKKINASHPDSKVDFVDEMGDKWQEFKVYHHKYKIWRDITGNTDIKDSPYWKATYLDLDWETGVNIQAAAQKWTCHAISKTVNLPQDVSKDTVANVYMKAWQGGCKGITVYREGSRSGVILSENMTKKSDPAKLSPRSAPKRPATLECDISHVKVKGPDKQMNSMVIVVGLLDGLPYEVFGGHATAELPKSAKTGTVVKSKNDKNGNSTYTLNVTGDGTITDLSKTLSSPDEQAFTRLLSTALRHGTPVNFIVDQLNRGTESGDIFTFSKALSRVLKKYITDGTKIHTDKSCTACGADAMIYQEGCAKCTGCGASKC